MKSHSFSSFILLILVVVVTTFFHFKEHFSGLKFYKTTSQKLKHNIEQERLRSILAENQLLEYQQKVAALIPKQKIPGFERKTNLRDLASIIQTSNEEMGIRSSTLLYKRATKAFREKNFKEASINLERIIAKYPDSVYLAKAFFLLTEIHFKQKKYKKVISSVENMVVHTPGNNLTGFALLRLAEVYNIEDRPDEAEDIYQLIIRQYTDKRLLEQTKSYMRKSL